MGDLTAAVAIDKTKKCEADDKNKDGVYEEGETQECGGEEFGNGGDDGTGLPPADDAGSHQWNNYHYTKPASEQRKIIARDSTTGSWTDKLPNVLSDWGQSSKFRFVKQQAATDSGSRLNCSMPDSYGRVHVCNHSDYNFSGAGLATIRVNSENHIQKGKVRVKNSTGEGARRPLLCQEVGHNLGLDHRPGTGSCMHQNASAAANSPDRHDYDQLVDQTHHHGGESETGGSLSDLDTGGGNLDGCETFVCFDQTSAGQAHFTTVTSVRLLPDGEKLIRIEWFIITEAPSSFSR